MTDSDRAAGERVSDSQEGTEPDRDERLRPFEGVRLSKGTDRADGLKALVAMLRKRER